MPRSTDGSAPAPPLAAARRLLLVAVGVFLIGVVLGLTGWSSASDGPVFTSQPGALVTTRTLTWAGTVPTGSTAQCALTDPAGSAADVACATGDGFAWSGTVPADGDWSFTVWPVTDDGTGPVRGTPASSSTTVDTVAPRAEITAEPATPSGDRSPSWTVSVEAGATGTCVLRGPVRIGPTGCDGAWTADLTGAPEGTYVLELVATDPAGNSTTVSSGAWVLDVAPAQPTVTGPASPGTATAVSWSFAVPAGATASCSLTGPSGPVADGVTCTSPWATTLPGGDGTYVASVVLSDSGGSSTAGTAGYVLDTTAPAAPVVTGRSGRTADPALQWSFAAGGDAAECTLVVDGRPAAAAACTSPVTRTVSADGTYALTVVLVDDAGNRSAPGTSATVTVDTTPPAPPAITSAPASPTSSPRFTWNSSSTDALACRLTSGARVLQDWAACTAPVTVDLTAEPDGAYTLSLRASDDLGNTSAATTSTATLDRTAPGVPVLSTAASPSSSRSWTTSVTAEPGAAVTCSVLDPNGDAVPVSTCGPSTVVDLSARPDGSYLLQVTATDAAGNTSGAAWIRYELDTTPPAAPSVAGPAGPARERSWPLTVSSDPAASTACTLSGPDGTVLWTRACGTSLTVDLTGLPDGTYRMSAVSTDAVGNVSATGMATYLLDTTPPAVPALTSDPGPSASASWLVSWTGEAGATASCSLSRAGTALRTTACASPSTQDLAGLPDGTYTLAVTLTDAAGNTSGAAVVTRVLDTTAPAAPSLTAPTGPSSAPAWTVSWTGEAGAAATCRLTLGATVLLVASPCAGTATYDLSSRPDGVYSVQVDLVDAAGNRSPATAVSYTLDRTPPAAPVVTAPASPGQATAPAWGIAAEPGAAVSCTVTAPDGSARPAVACTSGFTPDLSSADGLWTVAAVASDAAGNTSATGSASYVLDRVAPGAPVVTAPGSPSSGRAPVWRVAAESGSRLDCVVSGPGTLVVLSGPCGSTVPVDLSGLPDGTYTLRVTATDAAGNTSAATTSSYTLDTTAPGAAAFTTTPPSPAQNRAPSWSWTAEPGAQQLCRLTGPAGAVLDWASCAAPFTADLAGRPDGTYRLDVQVVDAAGNASAVSSSTYVLDTTAPVTVAVVAPGSPGNDRAPSWALTAEPGSVALCREGDTGGFGACTTAGSYRMDLAAAPDGTYVLWVEAVDAAGNVGPATRLTYVLDTTAPSAPVFTTVPATSANRRPQWAFTTDAGTTVRCTLTDPAGGVLADTSCTSSYRADLRTLADGPYTLTLAATDAAGNRSSTASSTYLLDTVAPAAPVVTPPASPGSTRTPTWTFTGEGAGSCQLRSGSTVLVPWSSCSGSWTVDLTGRPDGVYTADIRTTDAAGNPSPVTTTTYVLDTTAPAAATVTAPASPASVARPSFAVTLPEAGGTVTCRLLLSGAVVQDWGPCAAGTAAGTYVADLSGRVDGRYRFEVRLTDAAGNVGAAAGADYTYDTTPPAAVLVGAPASPGSSRTPWWSLGTEPGAAVQCDVGQTGQFRACTFADGEQLDLLTAPDGTYRVDVRAVDVAGNVGPVTTLVYQLDTTPPAAVPVTVTPAGPASVRAPSWTWAPLESGLTSTCELRLGQTPTSSGPCSAGTSPVLDRDGTWQLTVVLRDAAGNASAPSTATYTLDTVAPAAPVVLGPSSPNSTADVAYSSTVEDGATRQCRLLLLTVAGPAVVADWRACAAADQVQLPAPGDYLVQVRAVDAAGNISAVTDFPYTYDPAAPAGLTGIGYPDSLTSNDQTPTWTWTAPAGATTTCTLTSPSGSTSTSACDGGYTPAVPITEEGLYQLTVEVTDLLGNHPRWSTGYTLDTTPPVAPVVTPDGASSQSASVSWTWSGSSDAVSFTCVLRRDGVVVLEQSACTPFGFDATPYGQGGYTLDVQALDTAGNLSSAGTGRWSWDQTAPAVPAIASSAGTSGPTRTVLWNWAAEPGVTQTCTVRRAGSSLLVPVACSGSYLLDLGGQPDGTYELVLQLTDAAQNTTTARTTYTLLSARPAPVLAPLRTEPPAAADAPTGRTSPAGRVQQAAPVVAVPPSPPADPQAPTSDRDPVRRGLALPAPITSAVKEIAEAPLLGLPGGPLSGARAVEALKDVAGETIRRPQVPIALLLLVGLFLLVQNRIDRRDPKLAAGDGEDDPDLLFRPFRPGGATA